jgi:hypothetical protein
MDLYIPFSDNWRSVGIALSGGADSALLAYMICDKIPSNRADFTVHVINNIRCWKTKPWQQTDAKSVIRWLENRFPNITFKVHTNFVAPELEHAYGTMITDEYGKEVSGDTLELRAFAEFVCVSEDVDAYFNGVTRNPKDVDLGGMVARDIDPTMDNSHLQLMEHMDRMVSHPFRFADKSQIMLQYKRLGLEDLLNRTRSCEGEFDHITYKTYTPGQYVPVCGKCFWCLEREWALNENN